MGLAGAMGGGATGGGGRKEGGGGDLTERKPAGSPALGFSLDAILSIYRVRLRIMFFLLLQNKASFGLSDFFSQ